MKIRLNTDFADWYDYQFAGKYENAITEFTRIANDPKFSLPKREQFQLLEEIGLNTPIHGEVFKVGVQPNKLVVYLDEFAHRGEGKVLADSQEAIALYPYHYCSVWINTASEGVKSSSWRLLQIGEKAWWLKYQNPDSWLSNVGDNVCINLESEATGFWEENERYASVLANYPLYAIDFVTYKNRLLAIDFNSAPGTKFTGVENVVSAKGIYDLIAAHLMRTFKYNV